MAAVSNQLTYDNVYTERYMGLPRENPEDYKQSSPITFAGNLKGNLLIVHGTGDDNVHYQNAEMLINELIRKNKQFTMMSYPNRSHGINEGRNTTVHLYTLLTNYLMKNCPPGGHYAGSRITVIGILVIGIDRCQYRSSIILGSFNIFV